eukprot:5375203-Prymnesium_polylepis.1
MLRKSVEYHIPEPKLPMTMPAKRATAKHVVSCGRGTVIGSPRMNAYKRFIPSSQAMNHGGPPYGLYSKREVESIVAYIMKISRGPSPNHQPSTGSPRRLTLSAMKPPSPLRSRLVGVEQPRREHLVEERRRHKVAVRACGRARGEHGDLRGADGLKAALAGVAHGRHVASRGGVGERIPRIARYGGDARLCALGCRGVDGDELKAKEALRSRRAEAVVQHDNHRERHLDVVQEVHAALGGRCGGASVR